MVVDQVSEDNDDDDDNGGDDDDEENSLDRFVVFWTCLGRHADRWPAATWQLAKEMEIHHVPVSHQSISSMSFFLLWCESVSGWMCCSPWTRGTSNSISAASSLNRIFTCHDHRQLMSIVSHLIYHQLHITKLPTDDNAMASATETMAVAFFRFVSFCRCCCCFGLRCSFYDWSLMNISRSDNSSQTPSSSAPNRNIILIPTISCWGHFNGSERKKEAFDLAS